MTEDEVREHARAFGDALVAGDVDRAIQDLSDELRRNVGEVLALLPLPAREVTVESVDHSGSGYNVVLRLVGEASEDHIQTRWKDRDGGPRIVEASHLSRTALAAQLDLDVEAGGAGDGPGGGSGSEGGG
ncbi:MAG TPA: hypothetical protein VFV53_00450 [Candidatus Limnocylindrales bacterium]|nr:hypothetical protein [Candidatus Limnocylindrales bacterium]